MKNRYVLFGVVAIAGCGGGGSISTPGGGGADIDYGVITGRGVVEGSTVTTNSESWSATGFAGTFSDLRLRAVDQSIDNLRFLVTAGSSKTTYRLAYVGVNGQGFNYVTPSGYDVAPSLSPDGKKVLYSYAALPITPTSAYRMRQMLFNGSGIANIGASAPAGWNDVFLSWSENGGEAAFVRFNGTTNASELRRLNTTSGSVTSAIATSTTFIRNLYYTNNNQAIYYCTENGAADMKAFRVGIGGGTVTEMFSVLGKDVIGFLDSPAGDGQVAAVTDGTNTEVFAVGDDSRSIATVPGTARYLVPVRGTPWVGLQGYDADGYWMSIVNTHTGEARPFYKTGMTMEGMTALLPFSDRILAGSGGTFGATLNGMIFTQQNARVGSVVGFRAVTPSTISMRSLTGDNTTGPNLNFEVRADSINYLAFMDAGAFSPKISVGGSPATANGAFVSFGADTGAVAAVIPYTGSRSAGAFRMDGTTAVFSGDFPAVYNGKGENIATNGASSVRVAKDGTVTVQR